MICSGGSLLLNIVKPSDGTRFLNGLNSQDANTL